MWRGGGAEQGTGSTTARGGRVVYRKHDVSSSHGRGNAMLAMYCIKKAWGEPRGQRAGSTYAHLYAVLLQPWQL